MENELERGVQELVDLLKAFVASPRLSETKALTASLECFTDSFYSVNSRDIVKARTLLQELADKIILEVKKYDRR